MSAAEGRSYASCTRGTCTSLYIALPLKRAGRGEADKDKGPVDLCPAERARHGWRAPDLQARAGKAQRRKSRVHPQGQGCPFGGPAEARKTSEGTG